MSKLQFEVDEDGNQAKELTKQYFKNVKESVVKKIIQYFKLDFFVVLVSCKRYFEIEQGCNADLVRTSWEHFVYRSYIAQKYLGNHATFASLLLREFRLFGKSEQG